MSTNVATCGPKANAAEVAEIAWSADCGAVPVVDEKNKVLGIVTDRDFFIALGTRDKRPSELTVHEVMSDEVATCTPDCEARRALNLMESHKVRRLPVVDQDGLLRGMISLNDLIRHATPSGELSFANLVSALRSIGAHARTTSAGAMPALVGTR
jgi:CBS domain-containing protein